jgi:hypothetical protein
MAPSLPQILCRCLSSSRSLPQTCEEVSTAPKFDYSISQSPSILNTPSSLLGLSVAHENAVAESESTLQSSRGSWKHLKELGSNVKGYRSVLEVCVYLSDWITFCWRIGTVFIFPHMRQRWWSNVIFGFSTILLGNSLIFGNSAAEMCLSHASPRTEYIIVLRHPEI